MAVENTEQSSFKANNEKENRNLNSTEKQSILQIQISEEPLTAHLLGTIISSLTELHTKCWLIQQNRLADLMIYTQTPDPHFIREANLRIGTITHNSPAVVDFLMNSGGSFAGAVTLALALKATIDAVIQTPLRFQAAKLQNQREMLEQQIREQETQQNQHIASKKAEVEIQAEQQDQQFAFKKAQIEVEKQTTLIGLAKEQFEIEKEKLKIEQQRLELEKSRLHFFLDIAKTMIDQIRSDIDTESREMIIHSLIPHLLPFTTVDGLKASCPETQISEGNKGLKELSEEK